MKTLLASLAGLATLGPLLLLNKPGPAQHGPDVPCKQWCAPEGHEDHTTPPDDIPMVTCAGTASGQCANESDNAECGGDPHLRGCSEFCRDQCCTCCAI